MAVDQCHRGHRICDKASPEGRERAGEEAGVFNGILEVEAIGVEFGNGGGGDDHAAGEAVLDDVEGEEEGAVEGGSKTIIGGRCEGEEIDLWGWLGADEGAAVLGRASGWHRRDLEDEDGLWLGHADGGGDGNGVGGTTCS